MRPGSSSHAGGHPKRGGRGRRQQHALKSRGKAKGPRALDAAINQRLSSWQIAAINAGAPSSAGVEYYLAEYLGWEDEDGGEDGEEVSNEECYVLGYPCWEDEAYREPESYGGAVGNEECYAPEFQGWEGEGLAGWGVEGVLLDGVRVWGTRVAAAGYNVDVMQGAMAEVEQEDVMKGAIAEAEEEERELDEEDEAARIGHYEMMVKWKKRQQKRKNMKWKQQRKKGKKDLLPGSVTLCHKSQEDDEEEEESAEEEECQSDIYQHMKKMKQQQERRTLHDDNEEEEEEEEDCMEPGEMQKKEVEDRGRVTSTEREREDPEEVVAKEHQETGMEEVEQQGPDDDFGFCKMGFAWDYVEEEDWYVVGGVVEM